MNALDALILPGISDTIAPTIDKVALFDENWREIETGATAGRIKLAGRVRVVVKAFDRMDGNADRRRLGVYSVGYAVYDPAGNTIADHRASVNFGAGGVTGIVVGPFTEARANGPLINNDKMKIVMTFFIWIPQTQCPLSLCFRNNPTRKLSASIVRHENLSDRESLP